MLNKYAYVLNNPLKYVDVTGMFNEDFMEVIPERDAEAINKNFQQLRQLKENAPQYTKQSIQNFQRDLGMLAKRVARGGGDLAQAVDTLHERCDHSCELIAEILQRLTPKQFQAFVMLADFILSADEKIEEEKEQLEKFFEKNEEEDESKEKDDPPPQAPGQPPPESNFQIPGMSQIKRGEGASLGQSVFKIRNRQKNENDQ